MMMMMADQKNSMEGKVPLNHSLLPVEFRPPDQLPRASHLLRKFEQYSPNESYSRESKREKICTNKSDFQNGTVVSLHNDPRNKEERQTLKVIDHSDPFAIPNLLEALSAGKFGSVTKEIEDLCARRMARMPYSVNRSSLYSHSLCSTPQSSKVAVHASYDRMMGRCKVVPVIAQDIIDLDNDNVAHDAFPAIENWKQPFSLSVGEKNQLCLRKTEGMDGKSPIILDSDEDDEDLSATRHASQSSIQYQEVILKKTIAVNPIRNLTGIDSGEKNSQQDKDRSLDDEVAMEKDDEKAGRGTYVGSQDELLKMESYHKSDNESDGLEDMWREMSLALECSKNTASESPLIEVEHRSGEEECSHSFLLKEDMGYVCRICGVIQKSIETIFDFQWKKIDLGACARKGNYLFHLDILVFHWLHAIRLEKIH